MRVLRHLFARNARAVLPEDSMQRITAAVAAGEQLHHGEVCFAVESALPLREVLQGADARARAAEVFAQLRTWDTELNNGVLIYLLMADHRIEIVADRGLHGRVSDQQWAAICEQMQPLLAEDNVEGAALLGIQEASAKLAEHFPRLPGETDSNELPDRPQIL